MSELLMVFLVFARLGLLSFGAGNLAEMEKQLIQVHHWITPEQFLHGYTLGQFAPGPNVLAVYFYGYAHLGLLGGITALAGFFGPSALLAALCSGLWNKLGHHPWLKTFRNALLPFGGGVLLAILLILFRGAITGWGPFLIATLAFLGLMKLKLNPAMVVLAGAVVGVLLGL
ncbi:chromate transporter [Deinococcus roseus]|uniref:Chromate transporter n=1 Tax=Deinococcus roseus TaxID=392414 RepID=A0ABQ2CY18_9DEIO|nr:chromate transporter [Deinococcus roseus]GGJ28420.1 chromate transporter [Deinococcus roseus]